MKTVAIIEGFSGGPYHTRLFRKSLHQAGFRVIKDVTKANIIVAHSAGIYAVPAGAQAKLLMLIGPTFWPGEKLLKRVKQFRRQGRNYYTRNYGWPFYIKRQVFVIYYFLVRHKYMWLGIFNNNRLDKIKHLAENREREIIIVRNHDDSFTTPDIKTLLKASNVKIVELPGIHDEFTVNPQPYINLIKQAIK